MASFADKVLVLGGEAIDGTPDNPALIHVLDTGTSRTCDSKTRLTANANPRPPSLSPLCS